MITLRAYGLKTGDFQTVDAWWKAHGREAFPESLTPPLGIVAEIDEKPVGALWAYQAAGIGVAFLEFACTAPGLALRVVRAVFARLLHGMLACLKQDDYGQARCFVERPGIIRYLREAGFDGTGGNLVKYF